MITRVEEFENQVESAITLFIKYKCFAFTEQIVSDKLSKRYPKANVQRILDEAKPNFNNLYEEYEM